MATDVDVGTGAIATAGALTGAEILVCLQGGAAKELTVSRLLFLDSTGHCNFWGARSLSGSMPGSGNLKVATDAIGGYALSTWSGEDYTAVQFVRQVGGSDNQVGTITCGVSSTAFNTSSDYRLKENVVPLVGAADRVLALKPRRFNFKVDPETIVDGFLAHEAAEVVPNAVHGAKDAVGKDRQPIYQVIDHSKLVPLLTAALQEALRRIEALEARAA